MELLDDQTAKLSIQEFHTVPELYSMPPDLGVSNIWKTRVFKDDRHVGWMIMLWRSEIEFKAFRLVEILDLGPDDPSNPVNGKPIEGVPLNVRPHPRRLGWHWRFLYERV